MNDRVVVTGHSLGAALATLTALELITKSVSKEVHTIHFGSPRLGYSILVISTSYYILS